MAPPTKTVAKDGAPVKKVVINVKGLKKGKPRNYDLGEGVYRFSRTKMFHKTARYKFLKKKTPKKEKPKKVLVKEKPIGGEKNGGTRLVLVKKRPQSYPTANRVKMHPRRKNFSKHTRYVRSSLKPGKILILVAGRHRGKRVVLVKVLASGLLLVTGPFKINGCPLRRISQNYVICTKARLRLPADIVPDNMDDKYFRRTRKVKRNVKNDDVFAKPRPKYRVSSTRKTDQETVDKKVLAAIKTRKDKTVFLKYLGSMFGLKKTQYPHRMKF